MGVRRRDRPSGLSWHDLKVAPYGVGKVDTHPVVEERIKLLRAMG